MDEDEAAVGRVTVDVVTVAGSPRSCTSSFHSVKRVQKPFLIFLTAGSSASIYLYVWEQHQLNQTNFASNNPSIKRTWRPSPPGSDGAGLGTCCSRIPTPPPKLQSTEPQRESGSVVDRRQHGEDLWKRN